VKQTLEKTFFVAARQNICETKRKLFFAATPRIRLTTGIIEKIFVKQNQNEFSSSSTQDPVDNRHYRENICETKR